MVQLSSEQRRIVESDLVGAIQVVASAGAGKTRVLTERVRFILENTTRDGVIALTFTNRAAEEMQSRLSDCEKTAERAWVATLHSVAQRILQRYGHMLGLPHELHIYERDKDRMDVFLKSLRDYWIDVDQYLNLTSGETIDRVNALREYMDAFSKIKRELLSEEEIKTQFTDKPDLWRIFQDYQDALIDSGGIDYDDILVYSRKLLLNQPWIADIYRARYKHICVDEAQDLNLLQYEFLRALCGDRITSVMMVGDPNQMIYGFNGSSAEYLCQHFVRDFSAHKYHITHNYRSSQRVINAANKLKPRSQLGNKFAVEGKVIIKHLSDEIEESKWIVSAIKRLIKDGRHEEIEGDISLNCMAVIARNRFVFSTLQEMLDEHSIPFFLRKAERATNPVSVLGKTLNFGISLKLNPKDWVNGKKLCSLLGIEPPQTWGNENILKILPEEIDTPGNPLNRACSELLLALHELDSSEPNMTKFNAFLGQNLTDIARSEIAYSEEIERCIKEVEEFYKKWCAFKRRGLGSSLQSFRNALAHGELVEEKVAEDRLMLSTVHTMKGLERDIVFLMTMCEGVFPDYRAKRQGHIEEERNNAFVAITRARRWLYITYPQKRIMPWGDELRQEESQFIKEINGEPQYSKREALHPRKKLEVSL